MRGLKVRHLVWVPALILGLTWLVGAVDYLRADGEVRWSMPRLEAPPADEHDLASYRFGPTVSASSYHRAQRAGHHPAFAVDRRERPDRLEKWACAANDQAPWWRVEFREPHRVREVVLVHAGAHEQPHFTAHDYRIRCLGREGVGPALEVRGNDAVIARHPLACADAIGVEITFQRAPGSDLVRVFEVEVWGS